jgi:lipid-binding SYLF domain-containing protein
MNIIKSAIIVILSLVSISSFGFGFNKETVEQARASVQEMRTEVLTALYAEAPGAKEVIEQAAGYAVFSSVGVNVLLVSTARGEGIITDNANGKEAYMKMLSIGGGVGMGVKDYRLVFVFDTQEALHTFITEGWTASAQADAAAKHEGEGDATGLAFDVAPGVYLYQMTEAGLALQATIQGTKFSLDEDLNE